MDKLVAKLISLGVLIILTVTFSVLPYFLVLRGTRSLVPNRRREKVIALLNCFGGGVFLATLLLHLITEGAEELEVYKTKAGWTTEFPLFNLFVAGGFFLVAFLEFFMHSHLHDNRALNSDLFPSGENHTSKDQGSQYGAVDNYRRKGDFGAVSPELIQKDSAASAVHPEVDGLLQRRHDHQNCEVVAVRSDNVEMCSESVSGITDVIADFPDGLRAFLLLFALSFHTIFDGLAVGLQDSVSEVWQVFTAIAIHKSIIAFCLGLEMFKSHLHAPWRAFAWICFFSSMSPIGIGLGIGLTSTGINELARLLSSSILQGVAAGTFLYVTFLEILNLYIGHNCHREFLHIFSAMVGFIFMACVKLLDHD